MGLHDCLTKSSNGGAAEATVTRIESVTRDAQPEGRSVDPYAELKTRVPHACLAKLGRAVQVRILDRSRNLVGAQLYPAV